MRQKIEAIKFIEFLKEDIPFFDVTSEIIEEKKKCKAAILAKQDFILAGMEEAEEFLKFFDIRVDRIKKDGEQVRKGEKIAVLEGEARKILGIERVLLNLISHASGVATATNKLVKACREVNNKVIVSATRKTLPGLRYIEKKAVKIGGGDTHRMSLSDMVLIKDNHIRLIGSVAKAVKLAKEKTSPFMKIEVEVSNLNEAIEAIENGADIIMLDNLSAEEVEMIVRKLEELKLREKVLIEVSGKIDENNIKDYARCNVDIISSGAITHSAKSVDISLEVIEVFE